jgi:hypothetical protein
MSHRPVGQEHLDNYREKIADLPDLEDDWFAESLAAFRGGDVRAGQDINHSALKWVLGWVEDYAVGRDPDTILNWANECNIAFKKALKDFTGKTVAEYRAFIHQLVHDKLDRIS